MFTLEITTARAYQMELLYTLEFLKRRTYAHHINACVHSLDQDKSKSEAHA